MVSVTSCWPANDVASHFGLPDEKMAVAHLAPALAGYEPVASTESDCVAGAFSTAVRFILSPGRPGRTRITSRSWRPQMPSAGIRGVHLPHLYQHPAHILREVRMQDTVLVTGVVSPTELRALYELAPCVVVPSLFEAAVDLIRSLRFHEQAPSRVFECHIRTRRGG